MVIENVELNCKDFSVGGYELYQEYYDANFSSFLNTVSVLTKKKRGKSFVIVGDKDGKSFSLTDAYAGFGEALSKLGIDRLLCFGEEIKKTFTAAQKAGFKAASYTNSRTELEDWIRREVGTNDMAIYGSGQQKNNLLSVIDEIYGSSFLINTQKLPATYTNIHANFRFVGENLEFYRFEACGDKKVIIPDAISGVVVSRISASAFSRCRELREVVIPDSVTNIGSCAFYICPRLENIVLPKKLKVIENNAFNYCTALKHIDIPQGTIHLGRHAFYDCKSLTGISIPASVGFIGEEAFANCPKLTATVAAGSYAENYCKENGVAYVLM